MAQGLGPVPAERWGTLQYVGGEPGTDALRTRWNARAAAKLLASRGLGSLGRDALTVGNYRPAMTAAPSDGTTENRSGVIPVDSV